MDRYIILRDKNARLGGFTSVRPEMSATQRFAPFAAPMNPSLPPDPSLEAADLSPTDLRDAHRDPTVLEIARVMPTRLITPMENATHVESTDTDQATWGVMAVGAHLSEFDGSGVKVAVLDTGIDADHPAFAGVNLQQRDFSGSGLQDANGHGTHCAGTIFGRDVEARRIGIARGVSTALIGKVLSDDGSGTSDMLFDALRWVASEEVKVVSMSLGFDFPGLSERLVQDEDFPILLATSIALEAYRMNLRMFDRLMAMFRAQADFDGGTLIIAAAGNESRRNINPNFEVSASLPAAAEGVISVGAAGRSATGALEIAAFSNTNPVLSGPGVDILSAKTGGGMVRFNGTSMACPHVAGIAALWWQAIRDRGVPATARAVEARLMSTCRLDLFAQEVDANDRGQGIVQAPEQLIA